MNGSIQKKPNCKYFYAVIRYADGTGRSAQKWVSTKCTKQRDAKKALNQILIDFQEKKEKKCINKEKAPLYVVDFLKYWIEEIIKNQIEVSTYQSYRNSIYRHILPYFENYKKGLELKDITFIDLQDFVDYMHREGRVDKSGGLKTKTIKHYVSNISKALDFAVKRRMIPSNPCRSIDYPKSAKYVSGFLSVSQIEKLLKTVKNTNIETAIILATHYGLRRGEILGLRWQDVDFENNVLWIRNTRVRITTNIEKPTKNDASRRAMPLMETVKQHLLAEKAKQDGYSKAMGEGYSKNDYVCKWENGRPFEVSYLNRTLTQILKDLGLPHVRLHDLRHSTATYLLSLVQC